MQLSTKELQSNDPNKQRLFFALDITSQDKAVIEQWWQQQNITTVRSVLPENYHITLAFLGMITAAQKTTLIEKASGYAEQSNFSSSYRLTTDGLAYFKQPQVAYLTFESFPSSLISLANFLSSVAKDIGLFQEQRVYLPHISIARKVKNTLLTTKFDHTLEVKSFSLYLSQSSSDGVKYSVLKQWSLNSGR